MLVSARSFDEYRAMFALTDRDLDQRILDCPGGARASPPRRAGAGSTRSPSTPSTPTTGSNSASWPSGRSGTSTRTWCGRRRTTSGRGSATPSATPACGPPPPATSPPTSPPARTATWPAHCRTCPSRRAPSTWCSARTCCSRTACGWTRTSTWPRCSSWPGWPPGGPVVPGAAAQRHHPLRLAGTRPGAAGGRRRAEPT